MKQKINTYKVLYGLKKDTGMTILQLCKMKWEIDIYGYKGVINSLQLADMISRYNLSYDYFSQQKHTL